MAAKWSSRVPSRSKRTVRKRGRMMRLWSRAGAEGGKESFARLRFARPNEGIDATHCPQARRFTLHRRGAGGNFGHGRGVGDARWRMESDGGEARLDPGAFSRRRSHGAGGVGGGLERVGQLAIVVCA